MTEQAKVGDYITVVDNTDNEPFFQVGASGKVVQVDGVCALVRFTSGGYTNAFDNSWWINHGEYKVTPPYSSTFTEPATAEPNMGHTPDGGGLQKHSIGDLYPLCVVGYALDSDTTVFVVENLERGRVACGGRKVVRQWNNYKDAAEFAERAMWNSKDRIGEPIIWEPGRPVFEKRPRLVLNTSQR